MYSGIGGQVDFMRGAALSHGGKPVMAFLSTTSKFVTFPPFPAIFIDRFEKGGQAE